MNQHLTGLIVATFTPMTPDGGLNLKAIERYADLLIDQGADGAFVCGSTGESLSLNVSERLQIAERWKSVVGEILDVIVHVGSTCLNDCRTLAAHAQKIGARAVSAMGPCFFRPATVEDLALFCAEIAASAPELPFYYYHIPVRDRRELPDGGVPPGRGGTHPQPCRNQVHFRGPDGPRTMHLLRRRKIQHTVRARRNAPCRTGDRRTRRDWNDVQFRSSPLPPNNDGL